MKILWIVLGVLAGVCLLCAGGGYFLFMKGKGALDEAGKFGDESFRSITASWDQSNFMSLAAPELKSTVKQEEIDSYLAARKEALGPLKSMDSHVTSFNAQNNNGETTITAEWNATVTFEKGSGTASMQLVKHGDKWGIARFVVDSPAVAANQRQGDEPAGVTTAGSGDAGSPTTPEGTTTGQ
jgi:hypothetical protein